MRRGTLRATLSAGICAVFLSGCGTFDSLISAEKGNSAGRSTLKADLAKLTRNQSKQDQTDLDRLAQVDDPKVFFETAAQVAIDQRDYESAVRHFANLTAAEPNNMVYASRLAQSLRFVGRHEDSERVLRQALRDNPGHPAVTEQLGKTLLASGQLREGVSMLEKLTNRPQIAPTKEAELRSAIGVGFDRAGNHKRARQHYIAALEADPLSTTSLNNLGLSYTMTGDLELAERALRRALVTPKASVQVRQNLAMVLALKGQGSEAERLARQDLPPALAKDIVGFYSEIGDDGAFENASAKTANPLRSRPK